MPISIGPLIKHRRKEIGLTLQEVSKNAGITAPFLSQIENNKVNLTVNTLENIARSLGVPITSFLVSDDNADVLKPEVGRGLSKRHNAVGHPSERPTLFLPQSQITMELLTPSMNRKFVAYKQRLEPGVIYFASRLSEPTDQVIYVLSGELLVGLESGEYILKPDDSIYYNDNDKLMKLVCYSKDEGVLFMVIISPPVY